jgi:hypothetical protein
MSCIRDVYQANIEAHPRYKIDQTLNQALNKARNVMRFGEAEIN